MLLEILLCLPILSFAADSAAVVQVDQDPDARQPQVAIDSKHRVYVAYAAGTEIRCATSLDGGVTFGAPVAVARVPKLALGMRRGPRIAATKDAVVITAVIRAENEQELAAAKALKKYESATGTLVAWQSTDQGKTWTGPTTLNTVPNSAREGLHALTARPDGTFFCAWLDLRLGTMSLFGARSVDDGKTWEPDHELHRSPEKAICTCCHPSLSVAPNGDLLLMWRDDLKGARDMYLRRSKDAGTTFEPAQKLGKRTWIYGQCPMDGGAIAVEPDGRITTGWMRAGEVYLASPGVNAEEPVGAGVQPWVTATPKGVAAVWLAKRPGPLTALLPGQAATVTLSPAANDPVVASAPGAELPVIAAWESSTETAKGISLQVLVPSR